MNFLFPKNTVSQQSQAFCYFKMSKGFFSCVGYYLGARAHTRAKYYRDTTWFFYVENIDSFHVCGFFKQ